MWESLSFVTCWVSSLGCKYSSNNPIQTLIISIINSFNDCILSFSLFIECKFIKMRDLILSIIKQINSDTALEKQRGILFNINKQTSNGTFNPFFDNALINSIPTVNSKLFSECKNWRATSHHLG